MSIWRARVQAQTDGAPARSSPCPRLVRALWDVVSVNAILAWHGSPASPAGIWNDHSPLSLSAMQSYLDGTEVHER